MLVCLPCRCHLPLSLQAVFQQLEVDYAFSAPHPQYYPTDLKDVPVVRLFGVTERGNSVCARRLPGADRGAECEGRRAVWC